jgi:hypothetical protein
VFVEIHIGSILWKKDDVAEVSLKEGYPLILSELTDLAGETHLYFLLVHCTP